MYDAMEESRFRNPAKRLLINVMGVAAAIVNDNVSVVIRFFMTELHPVSPMLNSKLLSVRIIAQLLYLEKNILHLVCETPTTTKNGLSHVYCKIIQCKFYCTITLSGKKPPTFAMLTSTTEKKHINSKFRKCHWWI